MVIIEILKDDTLLLTHLVYIDCVQTKLIKKHFVLIAIDLIENWYSFNANKSNKNKIEK